MKIDLIFLINGVNTNKYKDTFKNKHGFTHRIRKHF